MPFSGLGSVPYGMNILLPELICIARKMDISRFVSVAHAVAQAVDQSKARLIIGRRRFGLCLKSRSSFEICDLIFPITGPPAGRSFPVHKDARPGVEFSEHLRIGD